MVSSGYIALRKLERFSSSRRVFKIKLLKVIKQTVQMKNEPNASAKSIIPSRSAHSAQADLGRYFSIC